MIIYFIVVITYKLLLHIIFLQTVAITFYTIYTILKDAHILLGTSLLYSKIKISMRRCFFVKSHRQSWLLNVATSILFFCTSKNNTVTVL